MQFTPEQQSAIFAKNKELLVSAAAGSGKTAVLVERILHMLEDEGYSIDRTLIVTYTRAAAGELRERLESRIGERALENPKLFKQAELAPSAQISTIHSYCQRVVREHFRFLKIDPLFSLGDERTLQALYRDSMEEALDEAYTLAKEDAGLQALLNKVTEKQLILLLDGLYQFLVSRPEPEGWLHEQTTKLWCTETLAKEPLGRVFVQEAFFAAQGAMGIWQQFLALTKRPECPPELAKTLDADHDTLQGLLASCQEGFAAMCKAFTMVRFVTIARTKPVTEDEVSSVEQAKAYRAAYKKLIQDVRELIPLSLEEAIRDMNAISAALSGLERATLLFMERYQQKKQEESALDFNDLEHMTLTLLKEPEIRALEAARFDAVFVDEYQDVSAIQEAILNSLKRPDQEGKISQRFFYVGDVKQSIYRFRLAEPCLFLAKLNAFSFDATAPQRKVILNKNFRSRETVLNAVNRVFAHVMDKRVTEIDYDESAMLYPGNPSVDDPRTELHILQGEKGKADILKEAELVAKDILANVGRPVADSQGQPAGVLHFRDIVLLLPVAKNIADKAEAILTRAGIPVYADASVNAMGGEEVLQTVQHLLLLDNLHNDVALIAELRGPLFELTESDLAAIRLVAPEKEASFLTAMTRTAAGEGELAKRCQAALAMLEEERFLYRNMPTQEYLWDFLGRSGMYAHYGAQPGGKLRQANLRMLCQKAGEFCDGHRDGLQGFLESVKEGVRGDATSPTVVNPWEDVVRIMTIHKSKGLEFPTVYVMGLGMSIEKRSASSLLSMHGEIGLGLKYMNEQARTKRQTLIQSGIQLKRAAEERAERARLLYVAMTRAKNHLVMVGTVKPKKLALESTLEVVTLKANEINDLAGVRQAGCYLDWLIQCLTTEDEYAMEKDGRVSTIPLWKTEGENSRHMFPTSFPHKSAVWSIFFHIGIENAMRSEKEEIVKEEILPNLLNNDETDLSTLTDPLTPLPAYSHQPLKLGVTALCRAMTWETPLSEESDEEETAEQKRLPFLPKPPRLMSALEKSPPFLQPAGESGAALRGVVTHKLLSLASLDQAREAVALGHLFSFIKEEIRCMTVRGVFTPEEAALIDQVSVARFFLSPLGGRMLCSPVVKREWSFNLRVSQPIPTMVQGVIDLCFLEDERWTLADFKTDRVADLPALWQRYALQLSFYRDALAKATAYPVGETWLYSLSLGAGMEEKSFLKKQ